jgi:hypothetical protein
MKNSHRRIRLSDSDSVEVFDPSTTTEHMPSILKFIGSSPATTHGRRRGKEGMGDGSRAPVIENAALTVTKFPLVL